MVICVSRVGGAREGSVVQNRTQTPVWQGLSICPRFPTQGFCRLEKSSPLDDKRYQQNSAALPEQRQNFAMVRLITHNLLACHVKGCDSNNFPLTFSDAEVEIRETEYNSEFLKGFFPKIEWKALVDSARQLGDVSLPETPPIDYDSNEEFLRALHHVLLEIHIQEGSMICPNCKHIYKIQSGIPNMLLAEHEVAGR